MFSFYIEVPDSLCLRHRELTEELKVNDTNAHLESIFFSLKQRGNNKQNKECGVNAKQVWEGEANCSGRRGIAGPQEEQASHSRLHTGASPGSGAVQGLSGSCDVEGHLLL
jgi:hypothetical protein